MTETQFLIKTPIELDFEPDYNTLINLVKDELIGEIDRIKQNELKSQEQIIKFNFLNDYLNWIKKFKKLKFMKKLKLKTNEFDEYIQLIISIINKFEHNPHYEIKEVLLLPKFSFHIMKFAYSQYIVDSFIKIKNPLYQPNNKLNTKILKLFKNLILLFIFKIEMLKRYKNLKVNKKLLNIIMNGF